MAQLDQPELALMRTPDKVQVPIELVRSRKSQGAAFSLACDVSGLDDKEIYLQLGIDAGTFSRMKDGKNTLPGDRLADFCAAVGNTILAEWLAYQVGCGLVMLETQSERRARAAELRADEAEKKLRWALEILKDKAV